MLGLTGTSRRRLVVVLDELAAGFAAALRDRVHDEHENLLRIRLAEAAARDGLTQLPNRSITEQRVQRAFAGSARRCRAMCGGPRRFRRRERPARARRR